MAIVMHKQKETEKEMEVIKREKLRNEIAFKNQELPSSTLHLLQKNQTGIFAKGCFFEPGQKKLENKILPLTWKYELCKLHLEVRIV